MIRMTKNGAFMDVYNVKEQARAESKGWEVAKEPKAPVKKTRKPRAKK